MADPEGDDSAPMLPGAVPEPGTAPRQPRWRRPWRVTYAGGRVLSTFRYEARAIERAREVVADGRLRTAWVSRRGSTNQLEVTVSRKQPPTKVDEPL